MGILINMLVLSITLCLVVISILYYNMKKKEFSKMSQIKFNEWMDEREWLELILLVIGILMFTIIQNIIRYIKKFI